MDQISYTIFFLSACSLLKTGNSLLNIMLMLPATFTPHYTIEYRKHFTNIHVTVVGCLGATESLLLMEFFHITSFFSPLANDLHHIPIEIGGFKTTSSELIMWFSFITGIYYNLNNIYEGYKGAKDKVKAIKCLVPYIQVYFLIYLASFSRFYGQAPMLFFAGLGLFQTYVAGLLNISSTAQIDFPFFYWEPVAYAAILYCDYTSLIASTPALVVLYTGLALVVFVKYSYFLQSMITQLTKFLGIKLLTVKDKTK